MRWCTETSIVEANRLVADCSEHEIESRYRDERLPCPRRIILYSQQVLGWHFDALADMAVNCDDCRVETRPFTV
jgi:hypothetical protein